ncbi:type II toxin-antitoxin system prevent-host-death family antitoxin [Nakamurella sp. YIM 132087]|uniref:Type II toxin-antitoxin system prevent-host-death family antitoxin n=1 Tax=Nakamurella alba TaxID=2665158 RepID=A0A7K1FHY9_9ACTN|nr:type II toxin-antitoxin system prevent-host-death family antitoxin [Nakamurella alba]MTD12903.1 type II toxin-antitoxin system prevent-host-death family antitoxin [Nakamurella alba]
MDVTGQQADGRWDRVVDRVDRSEEAGLTKDDRPVAKRDALSDPAPGPRVFGRTRLMVPATFDAALPDSELAAWE